MHNFLLFDRDSKFGGEVVSAVRELGSAPVRTSFRSPWQNGVAERWVGSCRRDLLNHVIVLNERHLKRLMAEIVAGEFGAKQYWCAGSRSYGF
jgi:putative transposase